MSIVRGIVTKESFERNYALRSGITIERLRELGRYAIPCDCGEEDCQGWQMAHVAEAVAHVWAQLVRYGYRPELITAREALRIVPIDVDREAFTAAWDERGGYDRIETHSAEEHGQHVQEPA